MRVKSPSGVAGQGHLGNPGFDHADDGVMHHPVAKRCGRHKPGLGLVNPEVVVGAVNVGSVADFFVLS